MACCKATAAVSANDHCAILLTMSAGLDKLKHIVVLMMENRSFDHMLGALKATDPADRRADGQRINPDTNGTS